MVLILSGRRGLIHVGHLLPRGYGIVCESVLFVSDQTNDSAMPKRFEWLFYAFIAFALYSCNGSSRGKGTEVETVSIDTADFNFPVRFEYAKGIQTVNHTGYKTVYIFHPDKPDTMAVYILYPRDSKRPVARHPKALYIPVPARTIACLSTTQIGSLPLLDQTDKLVGCINLKNICNADIRNCIKKGYVQEIGTGMTKNIEQIAGLRPEILLQDLFHVSDKDEELIASGINTVLYNEWKERDLLGRAEWMKLTAMLLGCNRRAHEVFEQIESEYAEARKLVAEKTDTIAIMYGQDYNGTWYLPGEYSYSTAMFRDARVSFDYAAGKVSSQPCSFEYIFSRHRHAEIWICTMMGNIKTMDEFLTLNERYRHFDATQTGKVYIDRKRVNENGGNDYWESGLYRPDLLLKDIIKITRPELLPEYETSYWIELKRP